MSRRRAAPCWPGRKINLHIISACLHKISFSRHAVPTRARARARLIRNENQVEDKKIFLGILFTLKFYIENNKLRPNALTLLLFELLRIIQFLAIDIGRKIDPQFGSYRGVEGWNPQFCMYLASM